MMFKGKYLTLDRDPQGAALLRMDPPGDGKPFAVEELWLEYEEALQKLEKAGRVPLLLLQGSKKGFLAGWSLEWLVQNLDHASWERAHSHFRTVLNHLIALPFPVIAVIHGPCLGEGLELALAADFRIALDQPRLQFGFLTEERGLLPEGGMLGRLISLVGWEKAALIVAGGTWLGGPAAKNWGLLDGLAKDEASLKGLIVMSMGKAISQGKSKSVGLPIRTWRQRLYESTGIGRSLLMRSMGRMLADRTKEGAPVSREALAILKTLPGPKPETEKAIATNKVLATNSATRNLLGFQAEFHRWQTQKIAFSGTVNSPIALDGDGNAGIQLLGLHARKGGAGLLLEKDPEILGRITLGLKKSFPKGSSLAKLATIQADPNGTLSAKATIGILDRESPEGRSTGSMERICLNYPRLSGTSLPGQRAGMVYLPERPPLVLLETPEMRERPQIPAWLTSLGCVVRQTKPGCELMAAMSLWVLWDELVHFLALGLPLAALETDWKKFGFRPGPLQLLDLQGLPMVSRMEQAWKARNPSQVDLEWASPLLERGFRGWPGRRGIGMDLLKRWVANPLAVNLIKKLWSETGEKVDPLWQALAQEGKIREARERCLLRLASTVAMFQEEMGLDEGTVDRLLVAGIGWPAHQNGPLAWAREKGWSQVIASLEKLVKVTGRNRYQPSESALKKARE